MNVDVMKLVDKIQDRIESIEKKRKELDPFSVEWTEKGIMACELRDVICDICDWAIEEIVGKGEK